MKCIPLYPIKVGVILLSVGFISTSLMAAPDFKIRYNAKFPCLEVMDSKAVKITDISEGTKGKSSLRERLLSNSLF